MKTENVIKIASLADQIKELAYETGIPDEKTDRPFRCELHPGLLTSELITHFNIRRRENGELINRNENHFLIYLNKRIFKYRSSEENHFEYNHFYVHCQVALNALFDWTIPKNSAYVHDFYSRVLSRRVDYVFEDDETGIVSCVIELDGNSHDSKRASTIDSDKASVLRAVNIPVVHIRSDLIYELEKKENYGLSKEFNSLLLKLFNSYKSDNPVLIGDEIQEKINAINIHINQS